MFQKINDKINLSFEVTIPKGKNEIITVLRQQARRQTIFISLPGQIDEEIKFLDSGIEIFRKSGAFLPFRPFGKITMTFTELTPSSTRLRCNVMPGNNSIPILFTIQTTVLIFWSVGWVLLGWRLEPMTRYLTPVGVIIILSLITLLKYRSARQGLIDYAKTVIKLIRGSTSR
jgi:hypothetical protein